MERWAQLQLQRPLLQPRSVHVEFARSLNVTWAGWMDGRMDRLTEGWMLEFFP